MKRFFSILLSLTMLLGMAGCSGARATEPDSSRRTSLPLSANYILEGVDFIIIAPTVEEGWETVLTEIKGCGIPVIIVDRSVAVEDEESLSY